MNLFFNTEITYNSISFLENSANFCFKPVRYFCKGNTIFIDEQTLKIQYSRNQDKKLIKTLLMIVLFFPAIILGTCAKSLSMIRLRARKYYRIAELNSKVSSFERMHNAFKIEFNAI